MSAKSDAANVSGGSIFSEMAGTWDRFWFSRMDPSTLGFIRIACGLLTLYVHLTYSWGLFSYVGKDAWVNHETAGHIIRDIKVYGVGNGWDDNVKEIGQGNYYWSIYYHVTDPIWIVI